MINKISKLGKELTKSQQRNVVGGRKKCFNDYLNICTACGQECAELECVMCLD